MIVSNIGVSIVKYGKIIIMKKLNLIVENSFNKTKMNLLKIEKSEAIQFNFQINTHFEKSNL